MCTAGNRNANQWVIASNSIGWIELKEKGSEEEWHSSNEHLIYMNKASKSFQFDYQKLYINLLMVSLIF